MSHKEQMLAEYDNRMQSTAPRSRHRHEPSGAVQDPDRGRLTERGNPRRFQVFRPDHVPVYYAPQPGRVDGYGGQMGQGIGG